jgi:hypothetical protein
VNGHDVILPIWHDLTKEDVLRHSPLVSDYTSYKAEYAIRDSVKCRSLIQSNWFQDRWKDRFKLKSDQNEKGKFENDHTGYREPAGRHDAEDLPRAPLATEAPTPADHANRGRPSGGRGIGSPQTLHADGTQTVAAPSAPTRKAHPGTRRGAMAQLLGGQRFRRIVGWNIGLLECVRA